MAHADYLCCACCDKKMYSDISSEAKTGLCTECAVYLSMRLGKPIVNHEDLLELIQSYSDKVELKESLEKCGFSSCYYENPIDKAYAHVFPLKTET